MGPGLFRDEPGTGREPADQGGGGFRIDPADRPFATSEPDRAPESWNIGDRSALRVGLTRLGLAAIFMAVAAGGLWIAYSKGRSAVSGGVPLIKADQTAMKVKPDNPGGVSEDGDTPVYSVNAGNGAKVEQLLPGPEQPMAKPQPIAEVAPPPVVQPPVVAPPAATGAAPPTVAASGSDKATAPSASAPPSASPTMPIAAAPVTEPAQATLTPVATPPAESQAVAAPPPPKPAAPLQVKAPKQVAAAGGGPLRIQIAATKDIGSAHKEWARLKAAHMDVLGDLKAFGVRVDLGDRGIFYRIQAGPIDNRADATKRCAVLKQSGIGCIIVKQP